MSIALVLEEAGVGVALEPDPAAEQVGSAAAATATFGKLAILVAVAKVPTVYSAPPCFAVIVEAALARYVPVPTVMQFSSTVSAPLSG